MARSGLRSDRLSPAEKLPTRVALAAGVGLVGGVVMALMGFADSLVRGEAMQLPAQVMLATGAEPTSVAVRLGGLGLQLLFSTAFGALFGLLVPARWAPGTTVALGGFYGLALWAIFAWGLLPSMDPADLAAVAPSRTAWLVEHFAFGLIVGFAPAWLHLKYLKRAEVED